MNQSDLEPVDVVITWVDGSDPVLAQKRQQFNSEGIATTAQNSTRFANNGEIYFCIASVLKNLPFVGTIYVVTDQQRPLWLDEFSKQGICAADKIKIVDHQQLFKNYEQYLPTFNSLSIEAMFWNIPELANQFIYLNDDVFINHTPAYQDCFNQDKLVVYGHWQNNALIKAKYSLRKRMSNWLGKKLEPKFNVAQMLSAEIVGLNRYYELHHRPHFMIKNRMQDYFTQHPEQLKKQIGYKFRNIEQFLPVGLLNHLSVQLQKADLRPDMDVAYTKPGADIDQFIAQLSNNRIFYGCIQSLDMMSLTEQNKINQAMLAKFADFLPEQVKDQASLALVG